MTHKQYLLQYIWMWSNIAIRLDNYITRMEVQVDKQPINPKRLSSKSDSDIHQALPEQIQ